MRDYAWPDRVGRQALLMIEAEPGMANSKNRESFHLAVLSILLRLYIFD
ncbi:hypothetical protein QG37_03386 [Candidozyma auris]|uniref:Uncharacterized protein n=1 Tax=Candidozyma auris TaxID=498019 RepID=A0A0L0NZP4_CANAR|nr:hypothetical protein QG37_03386 [[Candida] auris]